MTTTWLTQIFRSLARPFQWWVVVAPWERGVRVRLGKTALELAPGIHFRVPFLDRVYLQSVRLRTITTCNQTVSTGDDKVATVSWGVQFAVFDIVRLYDSVSNPEQTLRTLVESHVAEHIHTSPSANLTPKSIERAVNAKLDEFEDWGLNRLRCYVVSFAFVRVFRLLHSDYQTGASLWDLEKENAGEK